MTVRCPCAVIYFISLYMWYTFQWYMQLHAKSVHNTVNHCTEMISPYSSSLTLPGCTNAVQTVLFPTGTQNVELV